MTPTRIALYLSTVLLAVFGVVFVADALVESDQERLDALVTTLTRAESDARVDAISAWAGEESVAVVADRRRTWVDAADSASVLRGAIDDALPELGDGAEIVASDGALTGRRARITLRLRDARGTPVDAVLELAVNDERLELLEVRRMR